MKNFKWGRHERTLGVQGHRPYVCSLRNLSVVLGMTAVVVCGCRSEAPSNTAFAPKRVSLRAPSVGEVFKPGQDIDLAGELTAEGRGTTGQKVIVELTKDKRRTDSYTTLVLNLSETSTPGAYSFATTLKAPMQPGKYYVWAQSDAMSRSVSKGTGVSSNLLALAQIEVKK